MVKLLLKVTIEGMFTPILWLAFTPFNNNVGLVIEVLLDCLIKSGEHLLVPISLGLKIGNPGDSCP